MGTNSQTPFLWGAGTSNNGLIQSALTLMTTELNSLANASGVVSSVGGTSGAFTNSNAGQAVIGDIVFTFGGAATPTTGATFAGWFLKSKDGGSTFEGAAQPVRPPDFTMAPLLSAYASGGQVWSIGTHGIQIPAYPFKVWFENLSNVALPASGNTLILVSPTLDY